MPNGLIQLKPPWPVPHAIVPCASSVCRAGPRPPLQRRKKSQVFSGPCSVRRAAAKPVARKSFQARAFCLEFDPDEYSSEKLDPDEYHPSQTDKQAHRLKPRDAVQQQTRSQQPQQQQQRQLNQQPEQRQRERPAALLDSAAPEHLEIAGAPTERAETASSSGRHNDPQGQHDRVLSALTAGPRALASVPLEAWSAVVVTSAAAGALLGEIADVGWRLAGQQANTCKQAAAGTRVGRTATRAKQGWKAVMAQLPEGIWNKIMWLWDCPPVKQLRITMTMAQWSVRIPAIIALFATQGGLLATQVSLPMLAPLLVGTGMLLRTVMSNASFIFPRVGLMVTLTWGLWFTNRVIQNTVVYLRRQGTIDHQLSGSIITASECTAMVSGGIILLTLLGVNVSALLVPAAFAVAYAAKDLSHNFLAGFFLFAAQPFRRGDRVAVSSAMQPAAAAGWFEGICEKVDLRYTIVRNGKRRLYVPNSTFLTREFMVVDDPEARSRHQELEASAVEASAMQATAMPGPVPPYPHAYVHGPDGHPRWMGASPYDPYFMNGRGPPMPQPEPHPAHQTASDSRDHQPPSPPSNGSSSSSRNGSGEHSTRSNGASTQQQSSPQQHHDGSPYKSRPTTSSPASTQAQHDGKEPSQQTSGSTAEHSPKLQQPAYYQHAPHPGFAAYGQPTGYWTASASPYYYAPYGFQPSWESPRN